MDFEEYAAKKLLREGGISTPASRLANSVEEAVNAAIEIGPCVIKAQVPTGKRGKAGGIRPANSPEEFESAARSILGMDIDGHKVERLLVESRVSIARELYVAILNDVESRSPLLLFSTSGGMDIEDTAENKPTDMLRIHIDITKGLEKSIVHKALENLNLGNALDKIVDTLNRLYEIYRRHDAELLEINPLAITTSGEVTALDCKFVLDDSALPRQEKLLDHAAPEKLTPQEEKAKLAGLKFIELGGSVGVLANGAGLTMTTMDAIKHYGGSPANFLEIGGEAYTKAKVALEILLESPNLQSLLVNFCGAFARTDVMTEGVINAWKELQPEIPVFFTIHGTGEERAVDLVQQELGMKPFDLMDDAVKAAVNAAGDSMQ